MEKELKTLKDLYEPKEFLKGKGTLKVVQYWKLKQEAIKDIKYLRLMQSQPSNIKFLPWITTVDEGSGINAIIGYIKWKFNITEKDLNEKKKK